MINPGCVVIAGAGAGDSELLTLKALKAIQAADCIVYDRLVNPDILKHATPECELIYGGKTSCGCSNLQDSINKILLQKAKARKKVLRLKGGDPLVFGRGYEEALYLEQHGIAHQFIPGISSLLAVPMAAGIPLTHRHIASSFHTFTGHGADSNLDYATIAKLQGTLVFFMAVGTLDEICNQLIDNGKGANTPTALIENGTLSNQRVIQGNLATIAKLGKENHVKAPALLIIGQVCALPPAKIS